MSEKLLSELAERGERRHETCRFGRLTQAWIVGARGETPTTAPLCTWSLPSPCPPGLRRQWGGLVEYARDCAVCDAYQDIEPTPSGGQR